MAINPLRKQGGLSDDGSRAQANVENVILNLRNALILDGVLLENISVATTSTAVPHKLNRAYRGYIVCKNNTYADIKVASEDSSQLFINLQASAACTISLWVF